MTVDVQRHEQLPALAWLYEQREDRRVHVGRGVEVFEDGIVEGAWAGPFPDGGFDRAADVFGSGVRWQDGRVVLVSPSYPLDCLYLLRDAGEVLVSNSLAFVLAHAGRGLRATDWSYGRRFAGLAHGLDACPLSIPLDRGTVEVVFHRNIELGPDGDVRFVDKPDAPPFPDFDSYEAHLSETIRAAMANAADPARRHPLAPLGTLSSGYDSALCTTLGARHGLRRAITLVDTDDRADSGEPIAEALGVDLVVHERDEYVRGDPDEVLDTVAAFLAVGTGGEDISFASALPELRGALLFNGTHGDTMWAVSDSSVPDANRDLLRGAVSGTTAGEYRLEAGFAQLVVPFIGARNRPDIVRITTSPELAPYSVGGRYDRPIARRIVESAGVPRDRFGTEKRAATYVFFDDRAQLPEVAQRAIDDYAASQDVPLAARLRYRVRLAQWRVGMWVWWRILLRASAIGRNRRTWWARPFGLAASLGFRAYPLVFGPIGVLEHGHPRNTHWQRWALDRIVPRYRIDA